MSKEPKRNVYVGHRYVPKIMGEWDKSQTYEGLSIVTNKGTSYTSKKRVPKGIDILNEEYWVVTGNYNAQIEEYRKNVRELEKDINALETGVDSEIERLDQKDEYITTHKADKTFVDSEIERLDQKDDVIDEQLSHMTTLSETVVPTNKARYIAHRGVSRIAPENSIPAYEYAGKLGFWGAETDITVTSDGEWVIMHDDTVDSTTDGHGYVKQLSYDQIKNLRINNGKNINMYPNLRVPDLHEFLTVCKEYGLVPVIEIKLGDYTSSNYDYLIETIRKYGFEEKVIFISFSIDILWEIRNRSSVIVLQLLSKIDESHISLVKKLGNAGISTAWTDISKAQVVLAHENGLHVGCWTVDNYDNAKKYIDYGVDMITSNIIGGSVI